MGNASKFIVDLWVDEAATKPIKYFNPTIVAKETGLELPVTFERLLELVRDGKLLLQWEVRCPDCFRAIIRDYDIEQSSVECFECGEIEITPDIIFPLFSLEPGYRDIIKKKRILLPLVFSAKRRSRYV